MYLLLFELEICYVDAIFFNRMLLSFSDKLRDAKLKSSNSEYDSLLLSLRQLLRSCRRLNAFPNQSTQDLRPLLHDTLMTQFLPASCGRLVDSLLDQCSAPAATTRSIDGQESPGMLLAFCFEFAHFLRI